MKATITRFCLLVGLVVGNLHAADIEWGPVFDVTGTEIFFVPENGTAVEVVNTTNSGVWYSLDLDQGITLDFVSVGALDDPNQPGLPILASTTGDAQFEPGNVGNDIAPAPRDIDPTFLTILGSHSWQGGGGQFNVGDVTPEGQPRTLLLDPGDGSVIAAPAFEPLVEGDDYVLQILGVFDGRGCCFERDTIFSDGRGPGAASEPLKRGWGQTVIGEFKADDTTQLIEVLGGVGGGGTDPGLSAYVLWNVSTTGPTCDFNGDSACDITDINSLMNEVGNGTNNAAFDLNGDSVVDDGDRNDWLVQAATANGLSAPYLLGDANLDLRVNAGDLNEVGIAWTTDNNNWSNGNFTGGGVNAQDLNTMAINWQAVHPDAPLGASAVPEPTGLVLLLLGLMGVAATRR